MLFAACEALGRENVYVLRGVSGLVSSQEDKEAAAMLSELEIDSRRILKIILSPFSWPEFVVNDPGRCYFCKKRMYETFLNELGAFDCTVLLDGSNVDDLGSHRPGFRAIHEFSIQTPLLNAGLHKKEIRALAKDFRLSNYAKSSNSCLATRLPEGTLIDKSSLTIIEKGEYFLLDREFSGCRVRPIGKDVVLEFCQRDFDRVFDPHLRTEIRDYFRGLGFVRVLIDLSLRV